MIHTKIIHFVIFIIFVHYQIHCAGQNFIIPNDSVKNESIPLQKKALATEDYIMLYQRYISGIRGQSCPMYPSCSNYGLKVFNETNAIFAQVLTADRLIRCGHDHKFYSLTLRENGFKYIDFPSYEKPPNDIYYKNNQYTYAYYEPKIDNDSSVLFVHRLINNQFYQEALIEIMKLEFNKKTFDLNLFTNKIICLKAIGEYEKALFEYDNRCPDLYKSNAELSFQIAQVHYKLLNNNNAITLNSAAIKNSTDMNHKSKLILFQGLLFAHNFDWNNSINMFKSIPSNSSFKQTSNINIQIVEKAFDIKYKNPTFAGVLSIIPGLGYAYTSHKQTAFTSFFVNGLLAYAAYTSFVSKNYGIFALTAIFNLSFYIGNIYGAVSSANKYNELKKQEILNKLELNTNL